LHAHNTLHNTMRWSSLQSGQLLSKEHLEMGWKKLKIVNRTTIFTFSINVFILAWNSLDEEFFHHNGSFQAVIQAHWEYFKHFSYIFFYAPIDRNLKLTINFTSCLLPLLECMIYEKVCSITAIIIKVMKDDENLMNKKMMN
jgi:hypothetical protein